MSWSPRPVPEVTSETEPYWEAAADGELHLPECQDCGLVYYYPRALCPDCFSDDVSWLECDGSGTVYTYAVSEQVSGWPDEDLPLINAYVVLEEGPRIQTIIVGTDPDDVEIGMRVTAAFRDVEGEGIAIPVFEPAD